MINLTEAVRGYPFVFPRLPWGKYFLVDSGYASRYRFLPPYPHVWYHLDEFAGNKGAALPHGKEDTFN
ncbi:Os11g0477400 [Oryza sativa Japonica Group]|uniref:Os11g0477400 protein n=1 Tax=Oryza sativa subsp. japonica TaxID=39947 RepID=Q0ISR1_ORYSJ|nr:Os11g0477400 [Oryza sativa Japonica Group]|eukprot:NP_001067891.1 Os11g0477400 [Oryza sativa Japonica Group]